ncbi:type IV pilus assembly protein PilM [Leifsonia sp. TF02-11]|uniref:type IV pilus assembly protein PilM n=1 Tax=Leifsonia sp. TF02-11 TaxID=2815212 RepID=UPI001AA103B6|nr:type IV pilus assembly protein PilM [Leifsonia sp. TF02-11]MBO1740303.1 type IV pilus assembly protein PilM [Leifsonia sp. TF02-11]
MASTVVGVDIGSASVRAVELRDATKARPTLLRYLELPLPEGAASRGEVLEPNTVAATLKQLWKKAGFTSKNVVLGMGNQRVLARDLSVPKMSQRRIRESLPFTVQDMLPVPAAEAILDFYPVSESVSESGPVVNGLLVAAIKDAVLANVKATRLAGLTTVDVDLIPFALSRVLLTRQNVQGTVALIEIGAETTCVLIARDSVPQFVRIIPTGGSDLTKALRGELEVDDATAERIKVGLGLASSVSSPEEQRAVEIIYRVTSELLTSLRNTINYYVNTRQPETVDAVVLTGGGASLAGLPEALSEMTRLPVTLGDPLAGFALSRRLKSEDLRQHRTGLSVALGLAVGGAA